MSRWGSGRCFSISFGNISGPDALLFGALARHASKVSLSKEAKREVAVPRLVMVMGSGRGVLSAVGGITSVGRAVYGGDVARWAAVDRALSLRCE